MSLFKRRAAWSAASPKEKVIGLLLQVPLFAADGDAVADLAEDVEQREVSPGEVIIREGRLPRYLYLIGSGRVDVLSAGERGDAPKKVNELSAPDHFGEIGIIEGMPSTATVVAAEGALIYRLGAARFLDFMRSSLMGTDSISEQITSSLARTHPSYRPATTSKAGAQRLFEEVSQLPPGRRDELLRKIRALLDAEDRPDP